MKKERTLNGFWIFVGITIMGLAALAMGATWHWLTFVCGAVMSVVLGVEKYREGASGNNRR